MGISLRTGVSSMEGRRHLGQNQAELDGSMRKLASGYRITRAADDAAGLAISEKLRAQITGTNQAVRNAQDGISMIVTADGALGEVGNIVQRVRELAVQAANGTLTTSDQVAVMREMLQLRSEIDAISDRTKFNGIPLVGSAASDLVLQVGANQGETLEVPFRDFSAATGQLASFSGIMDLYFDPDGLSGDPNNPINDIELGEWPASAYAARADDLITASDVALGRINNQRATLGATQNRLEHTIAVQQVAADNMAAANSRIRDVDVAAESARMTKSNILMQAGISVLTQSGQQSEMALKLLGG